MPSLLEIIFFGFVALFVGVAVVLTYVRKSLRRNDVNHENKESDSEMRATINILWSVAVLAIVVYFLHPFLQARGLEPHILEWLGLVVRWAHVILGIAWIGASFYFIFLENSLNRTKDLRDELAGNLWAVHGGGFYYVEKLKAAPAAMPEKLHWFKYEAYFTWLTGIFLLILVYYMNAKSFMIDPAVSSISPEKAIALGIGSMVVGWFIYDLLCRTVLLKRPILFALVGFIVMTALSVFLSKFLSGRAAFIHIGALLGTIMAGNVFFVIIPSQKDLVRAARLGLPPDPEKGKYAGLRSLHNNYITLPVIFIMISNHFPSTFASGKNWIILSILTIGSVAVRHYINLFEKGKYATWTLWLAGASLLAVMILTAPKTTEVDTTPVHFSEIQPIIAKRCMSCHSSNPTDEIQKVPPNGIIFETPEQIVAQNERIKFRVVDTKTMPQGNKTGITDSERDLIGRWINQGARID